MMKKLKSRKESSLHSFEMKTRRKRY